MGSCLRKESSSSNAQVTKETRKENDSNSSLSSNSKSQNPKRIVDINSVSNGKVEDVYVIGKELGRGTFSVVKQGAHKKTGEKFAVKFIDKKFVDQDDLVLLSREIDIMKKVSHENVLSLKEIYETDTQLALVMELVTGGELFFKIVERGSYSERDASNIVRQIVSGLKYLHSLGIAHRDIKPENLLCSGEGNTMTIKIADFGLSKVFANGQQLETSCGTPDYAAPEVLTGEQAYDKSVDLWSVGVVTYVLLCGYPPFYANSQTLLFEKIIHAEYDFPEPEWTYISDTAKNFIKSLLVLDPKKRLTTEECLEHPFLTGSAGNQTLSGFQGSMREYTTRRKKEAQAATPTTFI